MSSPTTESLGEFAVGLWKTWITGIIVVILTIWLLNSSIGQNVFFASMLGILAVIIFGRGLWKIKKARARLRTTSYSGESSGGVERLGRDENEQED